MYVQHFYKNASTYNEFFKDLKKYYNKSELCIYTREWIHEFIIQEIFNITSQSWKINMNLYSCSSFVDIKIKI